MNLFQYQNCFCFRSETSLCSLKDSTRLKVIQNRRDPPTKPRTSPGTKEVEPRGRTLGNFVSLLKMAIQCLKLSFNSSLDSMASVTDPWRLARFPRVRWSFGFLRLFLILCPQSSLVFRQTFRPGGKCLRHPLILTT